MRIRLLAVLVFFVVIGAAMPAAAAPPAEAGATSAPEMKARRLDVRVTPEMIRHSRIRDILYFGGTVYSIVALLLVLATGISARLRDMAARVIRRPFLLSMIYIVLLTMVIAVLEFPLTYYSGYVVPHQFDLTDQTIGAWMIDLLKGLAVSLVIGALVGALALMGIRKVKRWWLALWIGSIPIILLLVVVAPIFIDPIFNKFVPLQDAALRDKLLIQASRAGIEGARVFQVDKSKQTKTMNAYVTGIGPTKRIVMWDTLLAKMDHEEVLGVMGHEMGHYVLHHLWKGLAFTIAVFGLVFFLGQKLYDWGLKRWGAGWGVTGGGDPASLPWLLIIISVITFFLSPVLSGFSRYQEHQSDMFGLELTRLNDAAASAFVKLAEDTKINPYPNRFIEFWRYSHPPIGRRIEFVRNYKPWEKGQGNQMWKGK